MYKFLKCNYCHDIILLTGKAKSCDCGACVGAKTGDNLYSYSGRCMTFQLDEESLNQPEGGKFIGFITKAGTIELGKKANLSPVVILPNPRVTFH